MYYLIYRDKIKEFKSYKDAQGYVYGLEDLYKPYQIISAKKLESIRQIYGENLKEYFNK